MSWNNRVKNCLLLNECAINVAEEPLIYFLIFVCLFVEQFSHSLLRECITIFVFTPNKLTSSVSARTFNHSVSALSEFLVLSLWYVLLAPHEYFNGGVVYK
jgi:hypothetical protein